MASIRNRYNFNDSDLSEIEEHSKVRNKRNVHQLSPLWAVFLLVCLLGLYEIVYLIDQRLPQANTILDEAYVGEAFIAQRAYNDLKSLTDLGPRVVGSYENEALTVNLLKTVIERFINNGNSNQTIHMDLQVSNGAHYLQYKPVGSFFSYANIQNIIVKVDGLNTNNSLLLNAHFDSVPTSPGASDDGISVAVLLEILRIYAKKSAKPRHSIIFLFNGAEETCLQASHSFITNHRWAKYTRCVLNLEASGSGGKMILFQSGPNASWLMDYYAQVPHPYGQAAGEEIFQSNIIPSDTDFRIFRDYGGLVGFDMAFFKDGYRYHTKYDNLANIPLGSFQHAGDNVLTLVDKLSDAPELDGTVALTDGHSAIYFDIFGFFFVAYSEHTAQIINIVVATLSVLIYLISIFKYGLLWDLKLASLKFLVLSMVAIIGGWIFAGIIASGVAAFMDLVGFAMRWYGHPWLIFGLYSAPVVGLMSIPLLLLNHKHLSVDIRAQIQAHSVRLWWTVILVMGIIFRIRSVYALIAPIFFNAFAFKIIHIFRLERLGAKWQIVYVSCLILPTLLLMYHALTVFALFVPLAGRMGSHKNTEVLIALLAIFFTILIVSPLVALISVIRKAYYFYAVIGIVFISSFIYALIPWSFPYNGHNANPTPQRYWIVHTGRTLSTLNGSVTHDAGYFLLNMDRNSPYSVSEYVSELKRAKSIEEDCANYLMCGLPMIHVKALDVIKKSTWIPAGQPMLPQGTEKVQYNVVSKTTLLSGLTRYNVTISGPDRLIVYLSPLIGSRIDRIHIKGMRKKWLSENFVNNTAVWNSRPLYVISHIWGKENGSLDLSFDVKPSKSGSSLTTEIAMSGLYVHARQNQLVPHFSQFLSGFPSWADKTVWLATFQSTFI